MPGGMSVLRHDFPPVIYHHLDVPVHRLKARKKSLSAITPRPGFAICEGFHSHGMPHFPSTAFHV
jgi:hypothetical protein